MVVVGDPPPQAPLGEVGPQRARPVTPFRRAPTWHPSLQRWWGTPRARAGNRPQTPTCLAAKPHTTIRLRAQGLINGFQIHHTSCFFGGTDWQSGQTPVAA